jgi:hypothetical protein
MLALAIEFSRCSRVAPSKLNSVCPSALGRALVGRVIERDGQPVHRPGVFPVRLLAENARDGHERFVSRSAKRLLRKEVIQPQLPLRLPCYDFTPIASPTFDGSLHKG